MDTVWLGFLTRLGQLAIEAALTLVVGVVVAGVLRRMVGPAGTRRLFGTGVRGLACGWLAGMLLPVCSLGVIPVARELRRVGVPGGTVLAFVLAAPLLNPISFLYGLTLAEPTVILTFAAFSLALSTLAGFVWERGFAAPTEPARTARRAELADAEPLPAHGPKRILAVFTTACRELVGRDLAFYAVGLVGSALLAAAIPYGKLQPTMQPTQWWSPLLMAALGIPVYSSPLPGMMKIGLMFEHGNSVGAAFALFALGIGTSLGSLAWLVADFDRQRIPVWFAAYVAAVVGLGYLSQPLLRDPAKPVIEHTHAFDDYTGPFPEASGDLPATATAKVAERLTPLERPAVYTLAGMLAVGLLVRRVDRGGRLERWLTAGGRAVASGPDEPPPLAAGRPKWDVTIPGPVLGGIALAGLIAFSVIGAYVYYPEQGQLFAEMGNNTKVNAQLAVMLGQTDEAARRLEDWDLLVRKLEVGTYLRKYTVTPEQSRSAEELRECLEAVRDALMDGEKDKARQLFRLSAEQGRVRDAVFNDGDPAKARAVVEEVDRRRTAAATDGVPPKLLADDLGPVWEAIRGGDVGRVKAACREYGLPEVTVEEAYLAVKRAYDPTPSPTPTEDDR
jgi:hypothetical protein